MNQIREWLNLPPQAGSFATELDLLHLLVIGISFTGSLAVAGLAIWWGLRYRRRSGRHRPESRTPWTVEILLAAGLTTLFVSWWVLGWRLMAPPPNTGDAVDIQVIGKQWMWTFVYPDGRQTINELVMPVGQRVRLHLTSRDVIHSLYLPAFRQKRDAVPQRTTILTVEPQQAGESQLFCAEYCGLSHSQMIGIVRVLSPADWSTWREQGDPAGADDLVSRGRRASIRHGCLACHTTDGSRHIGPSWKGRYGRRIPLAGGGEVLVDGSYLTRAMMDPSAEIAAGYRDVMPSYRKRLDAVDAAAIVAYIEAIDAGELDGEDSSEMPTPIPEPEAYW